MTRYSLGFVDKPVAAPTGGTYFDWDPENDQAVPGTSTHTRPTPALFRDDSGVWQLASTGVLRSGHNLTVGGGEKCALLETVATCITLHNRDFTNAVWVASNITPAKDATGIDGVASSASTLTATANNGTILQSTTSGNAQHTVIAFVARKTGTGTVEMTIDGGTTWVDITSNLTSVIDNRQKINQGLVDPQVGFRLGTSGDEIEVDFMQLERTAFATSPIETTTLQVQRDADILNDPSVIAAPYAIFADVTWQDDPDTNMSAISVQGDRLRIQGGTSLRLNWATSGLDIVQNTPALAGLRLKTAGNLEENNGIVSSTGVVSQFDAATNAIITGTLGIGYNALTNTGQFNGGIHKMTVFDSAKTQGELEALVA